MVITYYGGGSFRLQSGELSVLTDPENNRLKADVILDTLAPAQGLPEEEGRINFAGEYEMHGIEVSGIGLPEESSEKFLKTAYVLRWEDMSFVILGHMSMFPGTKFFEHIEKTDVLIIPTGAEHFLSAADAAKIVKQLEPSIIIPSFYKNPAEFLKLLGQKGETQEKIVFKKKDLEETQKVILLEAKS